MGEHDGGSGQMGVGLLICRGFGSVGRGGGEGGHWSLGVHKTV